MSKIDCSVNNCSHNKSGVCYANRINIGGESASKETDTCCGSFLNKHHYSDLTDNTLTSGSCDVIVCNAQSCAYNENCLCNLDDIQVVGDNPEVYTSTCCASFRNK